MTQANMTGKTVLVTGGTNGIGLITATHLVKMGADVTLVGRDKDRSEAAVNHIHRETSRNAAFLLADLSIQEQVQQVAEDFKRSHDRLDVLVNNAGAVFTQRKASQDGIEMTWALNHLNYFLLTHLLMDLLKASVPSRVVNVSSSAHLMGKINFDDLEFKKGYRSWAAYSQSKLANVLFTYELARRLEGTGVTANALHPGFVATNFGRSNGGIFDPLFRVTQVFAITPEEGAKTSIYLASSPDVERTTGQYFNKCKPFKSSPASYDHEAATRLWQVSEEMTCLVERLAVRSVRK